MARIISPSQAVRPKVTPRLVIVMEQRCVDNSEKGHEVDVCSLDWQRLDSPLAILISELTELDPRENR